MARRSILVLGAGVYQVPLIDTARAMGLRTVVISRPGAYPGVDLADDFVPVDTTDLPGVLAVAREFAVDAVVTAGTDVCLPALGAVVDALGLRGPGADAALRSMDKVLMKQAFRDHGVPTARFGVFAVPGPAGDFAAELGYPVMVKAPDASGSRGVVRVDRADAFAAAWTAARSVSRSGQVIVEAYLAGLELGAQVVVHGEEPAAVFLHNDTVTDGPQPTPVGHSMPVDLSPALQADAEAVLAGAARALGLRDCVANADLMLVDDRVMLIELGARMGATCLPEVISVHTGLDIYAHVVGLALGEHGPLVAGASRPNAARLLTSPGTGRIASFAVPSEISGHPDLVALQWDVGVGDQIGEFVVGPDRIGHVQATGGSAAAAEALVAGFAAELAATLELDP